MVSQRGRFSPCSARFHCNKYSSVARIKVVLLNPLVTALHERRLLWRLSKSLRGSFSGTMGRI